MNEVIIRDPRWHTTVPIDVREYPDGMPLIEWQQIEPVKDATELTLLLRPRSLTAFFGAMFLVDALLARKHRDIDLILPLVPGCRQDRANQTGDYLITLSSFAKAINDRGFRSVTVLDPHSDVTPGLIRGCRIVQAADMINAPAGKYSAVIAPDGGAEKRAQKVASKLNVPLIHAWKTRDVGTGNISGFGMELPHIERGSLALVVDDMCDAGGTFIGLSDVIDAAGIKAHLWVTHGLFTKGTERLLERYSHVYCSDSVSGQRDGVIEIEVCEKLLKGVF